MNDRGHFCRMLTADASTARYLILDQARLKYNLAQRRKRKDAEKDVAPEFDPNKVKLPDINDKVSLAALNTHTHALPRHA
eukprot:702738-Pleurochrysis_carterae.AAC.1